MTLDIKLYIENTETSRYGEWIDDVLSAGNIPYFAPVWRLATTGHLLGAADKAGKAIVQVSFLVTNSERQCLQIKRVKKTPDNAGHHITTGQSVLVSWSPFRFGPPESNADIERIYSQEVAIDPDHRPSIRFLGFVRRLYKGITYLTYIYEARYASPSIEVESLKKDQSDAVLGLVDVDTQLISEFADKPIDAAALRFLLDMEQPSDPDTLAVRTSPDGLPPHLENAPKIFISHATEEDELADKLIAQLESHGYSCWVDHKDLRVSHPWIMDIASAIMYSRAFVCVCSPTAAASPAVEHEVVQALNQKSWFNEMFQDASYPIIPVVVTGGDMGLAIPEKLRHVHGLDMRDGQEDPTGIEKILAELKDAGA